MRSRIWRRFALSVTKRNWADLVFFRFSTATIINTPTNQSGMIGFAPGPVLGHCRSASLNSGIASLTNASNDVPALARVPSLGPPAAFSFFLAEKT